MPRPAGHVAGRGIAASGPSGRARRVAGLGHGVVDHRHRHHPPLGPGPVGPLQADAGGVERDVGAGLPLGVLVPGPVPRRRRRSRPRPAGRRCRAPAASVARSTVDSETRRPASFGRTTVGGLGEAVERPGQADGLAGPGVSASAGRAAASGPRGSRRRRSRGNGSRPAPGGTRRAG